MMNNKDTKARDYKRQTLNISLSQVLIAVKYRNSRNFLNYSGLKSQRFGPTEGNAVKNKA